MRRPVGEVGASACAWRRRCAASSPRHENSTSSVRAAADAAPRRSSRRARRRGTPSSCLALARLAAAAQPSSRVTSRTRLPSTPPRTLRSSATSVAPSTRSRPRVLRAGERREDAEAHVAVRPHLAGLRGLRCRRSRRPVRATRAPRRRAGRLPRAAPGVLDVAPPKCLRGRRGQRERQRLAVRARAAARPWADVLLEVQLHRSRCSSGRGVSSPVGLAEPPTSLSAPRRRRARRLLQDRRQRGMPLTARPASPYAGSATLAPRRPPSRRRSPSSTPC